MNRGVLFVGGGVIGLSGAWAAARRGLDVRVVDPAPARGASWYAAGMLAPVTEATYGEQHLVPLLLAGSARWPAFAAELTGATGMELGYERTGSLLVAADADDRAVIDELVAYQVSLGLEIRRVGPSECRRLAPALAPSVRGGADAPGEDHVDNRKLLAALRAACEQAGVEFVDAAVDRVELDGRGSLFGVRLADAGVLECATAVVTAGCRSGQLGGLAPGVLPEIRPVKGHILRLQGSAEHPLLERTVRGLVHGRPCYLVPRSDGSLVVGATVEERGFDQSVQAGAVHALLEDARTLVPGIDELELVECGAGLRPGTADNAPRVGWTAVPGLAVASGHFRNGILLAPLTAEALAGLLTDGRVPDELALAG